MDALSTACGLSLVSNSQPQTMEQWSARYEAMRIDQDWWFKLGVAIIARVRAWFARPTTAEQPSLEPAPRAVHA